MKLSNLTAATLSLASLCMWTAHAIPVWDVFTSRALIGVLVPGTTIIHAYGPASSNAGGSYYLRAGGPAGADSNVTVTNWHHTEYGPPSRFVVSNGGLYQITNQTHMLYTNLMNATDEIMARDPKGNTAQTLFKLQLSNTKSGFVGGTWDWVAMKLHFTMGKQSNNGLFYKCVEENGDTNVYFPMESARIPDTCEALTLISYLATVHREQK